MLPTPKGPAMERSVPLSCLGVKICYFLRMHNWRLWLIHERPRVKITYSFTRLNAV